MIQRISFLRKGLSGRKEQGKNIILSLRRGLLICQKIDLENEVKAIKINTIFAEGSVILNTETPALICASSAFAELELGNSSLRAFGTKKYRIGDIDTDRGYLDIEANAVFGRLKFITNN